MSFDCLTIVEMTYHNVCLGVINEGSMQSFTYNGGIEREMRLRGTLLRANAGKTPIPERTNEDRTRLSHMFFCCIAGDIA